MNLKLLLVSKILTLAQAGQRVSLQLPSKHSKGKRKPANWQAKRKAARKRVKASRKLNRSN